MAGITGHLSGVITLLLLLMFIGIVKWAWSSQRHEEFEALSKLPLEKEDTQQIQGDSL